jgi:RNA polymerase sigma factor (sigma-70 family)
MSRDAEAALERLYRRHRADVFRYALSTARDRDEAEDVTQAAFLNAYRALQRGGEPRRPRAWLLTIAENVRRRRLRARRDEVPLHDADAIAAPEPEIEAEEIRVALERLPENQRAAIVLRELAGLSYAEIGEAIGVTVASVQMLVFRGRRALRTELGARGGGAAALLPAPAWLQALMTGGGGLPRAAAVAAGATALAIGVPSGGSSGLPATGTGVAVRAPVAVKLAPAAAPASPAAAAAPVAASAKAPRPTPARRPVARRPRPGPAAPPTAVPAPPPTPPATPSAGGGAGATSAPAPLTPPELPLLPSGPVPQLPPVLQLPPLPVPAVPPVGPPATVPSGIGGLERDAPLEQPSPPSRSTTAEDAPLAEKEASTGPILSRLVGP